MVDYIKVSLVSKDLPAVAVGVSNDVIQKLSLDIKRGFLFRKKELPRKFRNVLIYQFPKPLELPVYDASEIIKEGICLHPLLALNLGVEKLGQTLIVAGIDKLF